MTEPEIGPLESEAQSVMVENNSDSHGGWHLDKRVPIALIIAISFQTGMGIWWLSGLNTRVSQLEQQYIMAAPQAGQIIRLQTQLENIASNISEIKSSLMRAETWRTAPGREHQPQ